MTPAAIDQLIAQAQNGDGQACLDLYEEYKNGVHVVQNHDLAMSWLEKALDCNYPAAQLIMGLSALQSGDITQAVEYLKLACANNNADAMNVLGQLYLGNVENVCCMQIDVDKGMELLTKAGLYGSVNAQIILGKCYYTGKWVHKDLMIALMWLQKAIDLGSSEAQLLMDEAIRVPDLIN